MPSETVEAQGHLIDSGDLQAILTTIVEHGATYEILRFDVGRTNDAVSRLTIRVSADTRDSLEHLLEKLSPYGCYVGGAPDALVRVGDMDGAAPEDFYSTTNHRTEVRLSGSWVPVERPAHGRRHRLSDGGHQRGVPQASRRAQGGPRRLRHARRPRDAGRSVARQAVVWLHEQRSLVRAARRNGGARVSPT